MSRTNINVLIDSSKKHIEEFKLDTNTGTKRVKEAFHKNAIIQRNSYIDSQLKKFNSYKYQVYKLMSDRVKKYFPSNKDDSLRLEKEKLAEMADAIRMSNPYTDSSFKMGFLALVSQIGEGSSLDSINSILNKFIDKFKTIGITLGIDDFSYTMFTNKYMMTFFSNKSNLKETFDSIYWECPDFFKHIKLNLWFLLDKYHKQIDLYVEKIGNDDLARFGLDYNQLVIRYYGELEKLYMRSNKDEYINLKMFMDKVLNVNDYLGNSKVRESNFNFFLENGNFLEFDDTSKGKFFEEVLELDGVLNILKKYYKYEGIVNDLQDRFSKREQNRGLYDTKVKEIKVEEARRRKIYKSYLRAMGNGLFAKYSENQVISAKISMNDEVLKLYNLNLELHDADITHKMNKQLTEVSSIYDLFMCSYSSYYYMEGMLGSLGDDKSIGELMEEYFNFIYRSNVGFLTKISAFVGLNIADVIAEKYKAFGLRVLKENILKDSIDNTINITSFIKRIYFIENSGLDIDKINFIVKFYQEEAVTIEQCDCEVLS